LPRLDGDSPGLRVGIGIEEQRPLMASGENLSAGTACGSPTRSAYEPVPAALATPALSPEKPLVTENGHRPRGKGGKHNQSLRTRLPQEDSRIAPTVAVPSFAAEPLSRASCDGQTHTEELQLQ
jgi:hypothetical protein